MLKKYLIVFFVSMVPLIELRGAIPISQGMGLPIWTSYVVSIIGNMVPVPFIYLFARKILEWGADKPGLYPDRCKPRRQDYDHTVHRTVVCACTGWYLCSGRKVLLCPGR